MRSTSLHRPLFAILVGGGVAATFDIIYAILRNGGYGRSPLWVLQSVASGWLGSDAFESGTAGGALGLATHYGILFVAAAVYYMASIQIPVLRSRAIACGIVFGILVYLFMNFVVLPLSAFPFDLSYPPLRLLEGFVSHGFLVGIPIALAINRFTNPPQRV